MKSRVAVLLGSALAGVLLALGAPAHQASSQPPAARNFEFTYLVRIPQLSPGAKTLRMWIPLPKSDAFQTISSLRIDSALPYTRHREAEYGNEYLYLEVSAAQVSQPREVQLRFQAARREHRVALRGVADRAAAAPPKAELARFLEPDRLVPLKGVIADLSKEATRGVSNPLEKAHKIYEYVVAMMRYDKSGTGWGHGDAIWACTAKHGNCTDFHALFIGMARAAGIPARFEIGFPLPADHDGPVPGYHCWAEFYLPQYGWVPVDASEAWRHPSLRDYFFGAHDVNRVQFTVGRDIRLDPAQKGDPLNYFVYPYAEMDGKPFTALESKFAFRDLETGNGAVGADSHPLEGPARNRP